MKFKPLMEKIYNFNDIQKDTDRYQPIENNKRRDSANVVKIKKLRQNLQDIQDFYKRIEQGLSALDSIKNIQNILKLTETSNTYYKILKNADNSFRSKEKGLNPNNDKPNYGIFKQADGKLTFLFWPRRGESKGCAIKIWDDKLAVYAYSEQDKRLLPYEEVFDLMKGSDTELLNNYIDFIQYDDVTTDLKGIQAEKGISRNHVEEVLDKYIEYFFNALEDAGYNVQNIKNG